MSTINGVASPIKLSIRKIFPKPLEDLIRIASWVVATISSFAVGVRLLIPTEFLAKTFVPSNENDELPPKNPLLLYWIEFGGNPGDPVPLPDVPSMVTLAIPAL